MSPPEEVPRSHDRLETPDARASEPGRDVAVTATNQLWIADITSIRLETQFVYLAVVLDACSRSAISWRWTAWLEAGLAVTALKWPSKPAGCHHSGSGVQ